MGSGSGNRSDGGGGVEDSPSSLECDVGLGLKMQNTESYPSHLPPPHHHPDFNTTSSCSSSFSGGYGGRSGPSSFVTYDAAAAATTATDSLFQRTLMHSDSPFKSSGKILFTASQWQELERQTLIYKYMMASIPVPPQLLKTPPLSQSNSGGLDLRFSSGSDPEPWRCRRTDGKKWRCSRDVAPEQKYCERHAHKTRSRSRKHVENQTQISNNNTTTTTKGNNNYTHRPPILPAYTIDPFQNPISRFQTPSSASSFDQARCIEWFMKGGTTTNQQHHHHQSSLSPSSSSRSIGYKRDITDHTKNQNPPFFHQYEEEQTPINFINYPFINGQDSPRFESHQLTNCLDDTSTHTTRHFIDAWSSEREDLNSSAPKLLTLSMSGSDGAHEDSVEAERVFLKSHWLNPAMWMSSPPPGGPLGEALCLGPAAALAGPNVPSPHGYSNSNSTSSCSKNSCEDGGQGLNFH